MAYPFSKQTVRLSVEIFKTNVRKLSDAKRILAEFTEVYPAFRIDFDLDDSDCILRIEGLDPNVRQIQRHIRAFGFRCAVIR
jgi:hypothetical protein